MDDLEKAINKIRIIDLSDFPNVNLFEKPMDAGLWALWVLQDKFGFHNQHFTSAILEQVLLRKGVVFYEKEIEKSFTRAGRNVHKTPDVTGKLAFMISGKGKEHLKKIGGVNNVEIIFVEGQKHRTAYKQFGELIQKTRGKIMLVDKFYSRESLDTLEQFGKTRKVEFLTAEMSRNENKNKFNKDLKRFKKEFKNIKIRLFSKGYELHDRYIITSDALILLGRGIQELGEKESFVVALKDKVGKDIKDTLKTKFIERWNKSQNIT